MTNILVLFNPFCVWIVYFGRVQNDISNVGVGFYTEQDLGCAKRTRSAQKINPFAIAVRWKVVFFGQDVRTMCNATADCAIASKISSWRLETGIDPVPPPFLDASMLACLWYKAPAEVKKCFEDAAYKPGKLCFHVGAYWQCPHDNKSPRRDLGNFWKGPFPKFPRSRLGNC